MLRSKRTHDFNKRINSDFDMILFEFYKQNCNQWDTDEFWKNIESRTCPSCGEILEK